MSASQADQLSNRPSNDESAKALQDVMALSRVCHEANSALRHRFKELKSDGHDIAAMRSAIKYRKQDNLAAVSNIKATIHYSGLLGVTVTPETLFDGVDFEVSEETQLSQDVWTAEDTGYQAGRGGHKIETNPYNAGTEAFVHWESFWHKGQAALAKTLGPNASVARATRGPRRKQPSLPIPDNVADLSTARKKQAARPAKKAAVVRRPRRAQPADNGVPVY